MPFLKNQTGNKKERIPPLRLIATPAGSGDPLTNGALSVYEQIMDGTFTLGDGHFAGVEKPEDAEKRLLKVIRVALDEKDTTVKNEMILLRNEFDLAEDDRAVWVYFRVLENLWARLSDDIRSRSFLDRQPQVTEH
jgi:hypothetical protein